MPHGKAAVPFSKSMPIDPGLSSGAVPFVCRLFPLHPGYVMTVCALASDAVVTTTSSQATDNILCC